jgi:hypothetical protein
MPLAFLGLGMKAWGIIAAIGAVLLLLWGVYDTGHDNAMAKCDAAKWKTAYEAEKKSNAELKRRVDQAEKVQMNDAWRAAEAERKLAEKQKAIDETPKNDSKCLPRDAARRVRDSR